MPSMFGYNGHATGYSDHQTSSGSLPSIPSLFPSLPPVANLGNVDELVDQPLTVHFRQNAPLIVIPAHNMCSVKSKFQGRVSHFSFKRVLASL